LLALRVFTRSIVTVDAAAMAMAKATADRTKAVRFWSSIMRPPRNGSIARGQRRTVDLVLAAAGVLVGRAGLDMATVHAGTVTAIPQRPS